jgi:hypothetical protein
VLASASADNHTREPTDSCSYGSSLRAWWGQRGGSADIPLRSSKGALRRRGAHRRTFTPEGGSPADGKGRSVQSASDYTTLQAHLLNTAERKRKALFRPELERRHAPPAVPCGRRASRLPLPPLARRPHRTGAVCVETVSTRDTAAWLSFLDGLEAFTRRATRIPSSTPGGCTGASTPRCGTGGIPASTSCHCPRPQVGSTSLKAPPNILSQRALAAGQPPVHEHRRYRPRRACGRRRLELAAHSLPLGQPPKP